MKASEIVLAENILHNLKKLNHPEFCYVFRDYPKDMCNCGLTLAIESIESYLENIRANETK